MILFEGVFAQFVSPCSLQTEVYVHNYTRDITATRPENFAELTEEEKALIKKLGVYIKEPWTAALKCGRHTLDLFFHVFLSGK